LDGEDVNFVVNVGDSFYPDGVSSKDDLQWDLKWRQVYSTKVTQLQWMESTDLIPQW